MHRDLAADFGDSKIVRVLVAGGIVLQKKGSGIKALCIFHNEDTPSMSVSPAKDSVHCFGCNESGGYVDVAKHLKVNLDSALGPLERTRNLRVVGGDAQERRVVPAQPAKKPAVAIPDLPTETEDSATIEYLRRRRLIVGMEAGCVVFSTPQAPIVDTDKGPRSLVAMGYKFGALLRDVDGKVTGVQMRRIDDREPKCWTIGSGSFGVRARLATAPRAVIVEGLTDWIIAAAVWDRDEMCPVIGVPGVSTAAGLFAGLKISYQAHVFVLTDHDKAGDGAADDISAAVTAAGAFALRARAGRPG